MRKSKNAEEARESPSVYGDWDPAATEAKCIHKVSLSESSSWTHMNPHIYAELFIYVRTCLWFNLGIWSRMWGLRKRQMKEAKTETQERFGRSVGHCQTAQSLFQNLLINNSRTKHSIDSLTVFKTTRLFLSLVSSLLSIKCLLLASSFNFYLNVLQAWCQ